MHDSTIEKHGRAWGTMHGGAWQWRIGVVNAPPLCPVFPVRARTTDKCLGLELGTKPPPAWHGAVLLAASQRGHAATCAASLTLVRHAGGHATPRCRRRRRRCTHVGRTAEGEANR
jgi:hypothetical protein